ncbi:hypothetical protein ACFP81_04365 [Deinococcus lacus]|uniref:Uncharacterized protein n=1 Tax=Deinococcus lacus TaxID=392561 RepID=A0ABW1YAZ1_9DEIO
MNSNRYLAVYAALLTLAFGTLLLTSGATKTTLDVLDVQRINVREPDGTIRYVISNSAQVPNGIVDGKELPKHREAYAGSFFYNEEGTELGGLRYSGKNGEQSTTFTLDGYNRNETLMLGTRYGQEDTVNYLTMMDASPATIQQAVADDERMKKSFRPKPTLLGGKSR